MKKTLLWLTLLFIGVITLILQLFVFEAPNGVLGFIICMASIYLVIGALIKLYKINDTAKMIIKAFFQALFFWI